jgi:hypothetical protein
MQNSFLNFKNRRNSQTSTVSQSDRINTKYTEEKIDGSISSDSHMNTRDIRRERNRGYSRERDRQINDSRAQNTSKIFPKNSAEGMKSLIFSSVWI